MPAPYDIYPSVDAQYNFPPEITSALVKSTDVVAALNASRDDAVNRVRSSLTGIVNAFAGSSAPSGWLLCDGSAVSRSQYPELFATIGTSYGVGDSATTFNLPNLKGRIPVGVDAAQTEFAAVAKTGGEKAHKMTVAEMPAHAHGINDPGHNHSQNSHGHSMWDNGHNHGVNDPGHGHGVSDPGHGHGSSTLDGFVTYQTNTATRRQVAASGVAGSAASSLYAVASSPTNVGLDYGSARGSGTGIGINGSGTGIWLNSSGINAGVNNSTGTNNPSGTGVSAQNTGGDGSANVLQPYVSMNYIIHV